MGSGGAAQPAAAAPKEPSTPLECLLNPDGSVDTARTRALVELARPLRVTFHRAFDMSADLPRALEDIYGTGAERILTSGGLQKAAQGAVAIAQLVKAANGRIAIMAGSGINPDNAREIVRAHLSLEPRPMRDFAPDLPDEALALVARLVKKIPTAGGTPQTLADSGAGASWGDSGVLLFTRAGILWIGSSEGRDARVLAATNRDPIELVASKTFREDLYYRLNVFTICVPPLRERKPDILLLADHFVEKYAREHDKVVKRISTPAIDMLMSYHWPGNVRELENVVERAIIVAQTSEIRIEDLPESLTRSSQPQASSLMMAPQGTLAEIERLMLVQTLERTGGNKREAARLLGVYRPTLYSKLRKYNLDGQTRVRKGKDDSAEAAN
jgi:hypothetical protein